MTFFFFENPYTLIGSGQIFSYFYLFALSFFITIMYGSVSALKGTVRGIFRNYSRGEVKLIFWKIDHRSRNFFQCSSISKVKFGLLKTPLFRTACLQALVNVLVFGSFEPQVLSKSQIAVTHALIKVSEQNCGRLKSCYCNFSAGNIV